MTICREFWGLSYKDKRAFVFHSVSQMGREKVCARPSRRGRTFVYRLKDAKENPHQVCKLFYLSTLGYHPGNDSIVLSVMGKEMSTALAPPRDGRGRHAPANKLDMEQLYLHIESFRPTISHYRREHAPCRRYLPSDITIKLMFADFQDKGHQCGYDTYRKAVRAKNISFAKLGEEECEACLRQEQHTKEAQHTGDVDCPQCQQWKKHKEEAIETRQHYRSDAESDWPAGTSVRSVDLQKVIMLPRMPGVKSALFTRRLSVYHETFATVGGKTEKKDNISVVWHEGVAGRSAKEVTSAYLEALEKDRDCEHVIFWVDNCSAQNKNWCLLSSLVVLMNSDLVAMDDVTLKYFEPGHTFMSADSVHHGVEQEMKRRPGGFIHDFEDFLSVVKSSNSKKMEVVEMTNDNIMDWASGQSTAKLRKAPKLANLKVIQLRRGSRSMWVKTTHGQEQFVEVDFLKKKFDTSIPSTLRLRDVGVEEAKKDDIILKLVPLMPASRTNFWRSLKVHVPNGDEE